MHTHLSDNFGEIFDIENVLFKVPLFIEQKTISTVNATAKLDKKAQNTNIFVQQ